MAQSVYNDGEATTYELLAELARGGEGRVWKALQIGPSGRTLPVAIKVLTPDSYLGTAVDPESVLGTWRDQMHVMRSFSHEGFASVQVAFSITSSPVRESETPDWMQGMPAFVMAWIDGLDLDTWSEKVADPIARLDVLKLCARGLDAFHRQTHHVHGDLKPANVVVADGHGRIIDFGLVRGADEVRQGTAPVGSAGYLAPEVFRGAEYSAQTDLYAFAGILFHQLVLRHPTPAWLPREIRAELDMAGFIAVGDLLAAVLDRDPAKRPSVDGAAMLLDDVMARLSESARDRSKPPRKSAAAVISHAEHRLDVLAATIDAGRRSEIERLIENVRHALERDDADGLPDPVAALRSALLRIAPDGESSRVFLCHSSTDKPAVRQLDRRLRADGIATWLDERDLVAGEDWDHAIRQAVREAKVVLVCLSRASVTRAGYLQKEIRHVLDVADEQPDGRIFVIPVRLEDCDVPGRLQRWHWVDLYKRGGYRRVITALGHARERIAR